MHVHIIVCMPLPVYVCLSLSVCMHGCLVVCPNRPGSASVCRCMYVCMYGFSLCVCVCPTGWVSMVDSPYVITSLCLSPSDCMPV